jgi:hypothetical protein
MTKVLYCRIQHIYHIVRLKIISVAIEAVVVDQLGDHWLIYILHRPDDAAGKSHPCAGERQTADRMVVTVLLKPAKTIAAAKWITWPLT